MNRSPVGNPIKGFPENLVFVQFDSRRILFRQTGSSYGIKAIGGFVLCVFLFDGDNALLHSRDLFGVAVRKIAALSDVIIQVE